MNFIQQAIINIHAANNIANLKAVTNDPEYSPLFFDKTKQAIGAFAPQNSTEYLELYGNLAPIYRAVSVKAKTIAQLPIQILKQTSDGEFEDVTTTREEYKIFNRPNEYQTKYDFWEQSIGYLQLTGETPWLFERLGKGNKISQIYPLRPDMIKVIPSSSTIVSHYLYRVAKGQDIVIDPEFLMLLKFFNPLDHLRGLSPIAAAEHEVILDLNAITAGKKMFEDGAQPSGLISTDEKVGSAEGKRVKEFIKEQYTGSKNFGKIMFLTHGFKWQQMQLNNRDMQYMEMREWNKETIAQVFGVPPILQMRFKDSSVLQNTEIQYKLFWDGIIAELTKLEEIFTQKLLPEITDDKDVSFNFDTSKVAALQPDMVKKTERYTKVFAMGGVTPNEIRQDILGLEVSDEMGMDDFYIPFNLQSISDAGYLEETVPLTTETKAVTFFNKMTEQKRLHDINNNGGGDIGSIRTIIAEVKEAKQITAHSVYRQKVINNINKLNEKHIKSFKKVLAKLFKEQKAEVLANLYHNKYHKFTTDGVNFNYKKWVKKFEEAGRPEIAKALEAAAIDLAKEFNDVYDITDPNAASFVNKRSIEYAKMTVKTTKDKIDRILKSAIDSNLSVEETAAKLTRFFVSSELMRALRIARTEIVRSVNEGRQFAAMQMKKIKYKEWMTQRDGLVRDAHVLMDGETVAVGAGFSDGSIVPGEINERCYTIYRKTKG